MPAPATPSDAVWARAAAAVLAAWALIRLALLFLSPIELYPDEAQYWAWSRTLDWGYFSKPPMIAWLIAASTAIGGNAEAWVRLPAWACQVAAGGFVFLAGRRLFNSRTGFWAATLYTLAPGVALSAAVASTDAPLLMFLSAAVWAYVALLRTRALGWALLLGGALGLATLSKYAAAYFIAGLVLHAVLSREARAAWTLRNAAAAALVAAACLAPNLLWNATNGFDTVRHTAGNANWSLSDLFHPIEAVEFVGSQFGILGPVPFAALLALGLRVLFRRPTDRELTLWCLLLPPLVLVTVQALLSRANANWAAAFLPAAAILVAERLARPRSLPRLALVLTLVTQLAFGALLGAAAVSPRIADAAGLANGLKRARGWQSTADVVMARARAAGPLTAVAVDDRFLFNALRYYARDALAAPGAPPLVAWVREGEAQSEAETSHPLTAENGARVLAVTARPDYRNQFRDSFAAASSDQPVSIPLDRRRTRDLTLFVGEGFVQRPPQSALSRASRPQPLR